MFNLKKYGVIAAVLLLFLGFGAKSLLFQTSYAHYLENAEKALIQLQDLRDFGVNSNDEQVQKLIAEIAHDTDSDLDAADSLVDTAELED